MKIFKKASDIFVGSIMGTKGMYSGAIFRIDPHENITIGRDPKTSQIVIDECCQFVSRTHCTVCGNPQTGEYSVTDYSKNGTFVNNERLPKGETVLVPRGSTLSVGSKENSFKLN